MLDVRALLVPPAERLEYIRKIAERPIRWARRYRHSARNPFPLRGREGRVGV
jgi:hypothetical protein